MCHTWKAKGQLPRWCEHDRTTINLSNGMPNEGAPTIFFKRCGQDKIQPQVTINKPRRAMVKCDPNNLKDR